MVKQSTPNEGNNNREVKSSSEALKELNYPVVEAKPQIMEMIRTHDNFVLVGETGSGKTTCLPFMLMELKEELGLEGKIAVTQPRRVATRSVSRRVAELKGCNIGEEVGYQVRFEDITSEGTDINFMTDGILLRKMQSDPLLKDYSIVMVDEAHERSLNIDLCLGLLKDVNKRREEAGIEQIRVAVTSATIEKEKFVKYFSNGEEGSSIEIPGKTFPVKVFHEKEDPEDYTLAAAEKIKQIAEGEEPGDILVFMPGKQEIEATIENIKRTMGDQSEKLEILTLHAEMSPEDQDAIFHPNGKRKVIVATNIAETSITVPGIMHVIDSGLIKQIEFDSSTGIEELVLKPHAQSGLLQRRGRAGRLAPGNYYGLFTDKSYSERPKFQTPEIQRSELSHVILMMKKIGIEDVENFDFIDPPERQSVLQALETLKVLGALDETGKITKTGELMAELGLEPHIGRMIIEAQKYGCVEQICTIAALFGGKSVFNRPKEKEYEADRAHSPFKDPNSDFQSLLNVWKAYAENHYSSSWARENFLNGRTLEEASKVRYELFRVLKRNKILISKNNDAEAIGKSVTAGLIGNLMESYGFHSYGRVRDGEADIYVHPASATFGHGDAPYVVAAEIVKTKKTYARTIQNVKPEWISEVAPQLCEEKSTGAYYNAEKDKVLRQVNIFLKKSIRRDSIASRTENVEGEEAVRVFAQELAKGSISLPLVERNKRTVEKINDLWRRSEGGF